MATSSSCTSRNSRRRSPPGLPFPRLWAMLVHEVFSVRDASQSLAEPLDCPNSPGRGHATTGISRSFRLCGGCMPYALGGPSCLGTHNRARR